MIIFVRLNCLLVGENCIDAPSLNATLLEFILADIKREREIYENI
jgi:hypothetical protein